MMFDIESGRVNCVIVKDLSRLGRDYIESGRLIQKTFPALHVRFIALTDNFDSLTADHNTKALVLPVKNFINDSYCRDISQKVKSHQKIKREQGKYISAFSMYGYRKSAEDKNKLCPDGYAADTVRRIFAWKLEGMSNLAIARRLDELGVLSPMEYKREQGENYCTGFRTNLKAGWSAVAVKRILTNEIYTGVMVQGKNEQVSYKVKKTIAKPKVAWIRVEGTHEAIIPPQEYEIVQRLLEVDTRAKAGTKHAHLFSGILFCADCGEPMIRRVNRYKRNEKIYFICPSRNSGRGCSRHSTLESELKETVFVALRIYLSIFLDTDSQAEYLQRLEVRMDGIERTKQEIGRLFKQREKYLKLCEALLEDMKTGLITEEDGASFRSIYEQQCNHADKAIRQQEKLAAQLLRSGCACKARLEQLQRTMELPELDRDVILYFIRRIEVHEGKKINITLWGIEEFGINTTVQ